MRIAAAAGRVVFDVAAIFLVAASPVAKGEIVLDGSLGPRTTLSGPSFAVSADLGRQAGANLLHSFSRFNLASGESATFSGPTSVANIIGRVTGGSASQIDGLLRSTIAGANLYLINPKGIAFGPNASLDISGSFYASSADYVKFADGARFDAVNPQASTFTSASPAAFGFLGPNPSAVSVSGATLSVPPGKTLSLVGGDVRLDNATLSALAGRVNVASVASAGEITLDASGITPQSVSRFGSIALANSSVETASVEGKPAGAIHIRGGRLVLENSSLLSANAEPGAGNPIRAVLAEEAIIDGGTIYTSSSGSGNGGTIDLEAPRIALDHGGSINSTAISSGAGGSITVSATTLSLTNGASIQSVTTDIGAGGSIAVIASTLSLTNGASIRSLTTDVGAGGAIAIDAGAQITLAGTLAGDSTQISSATSGAGGAGSIDIKAPRIAISDGAGLASDVVGGSGSGGRIAIETGELQLTGDGIISAITMGAGSGGTIDISAHKITISGGKNFPAGKADPATGLTYFGYYSGLYTTSQDGATGRAGQVRIKTDSLQISDGAMISGVTLGGGNAGSFDIQARSISLDSGGLIHTTTSGAGAAGSISLTANELIRASGRLDQAKYSGFAPRGSQSSGVVSKATTELNPTSPLIGNAGSIALRAPSVSLSDGAEISTSAAKSATGGTIAIEARDVEIVRGASVSSESLGTGNAGSIAIRAANALKVLDRGSVTTEARSADGGDINIEAATLVQLQDSRITTSVGTGAGNGGNIWIDPQFVVLNGSRIIANAYGGNGGNIRIAAQNYLASPDSVVEASSQLGIAGTIEITSPNSDVGAGLAVLPANFLDAATLLRASCAQRGAGSASSLVAVGRGGLPISPEGYLPSFAGASPRTGPVTRYDASPVTEPGSLRYAAFRGTGACK